METRNHRTFRQGCTADAVDGRTRAALLALPLAAAIAALLAAAAPAQAAVSGPLSLAASPVSDRELGGLRGGFAFGGFDIAVGVVARSVIDRALAGVGDVGERLEVVTRFTVPAAGRIAHAGTTVQTLASAAGGDGGGFAGPLASEGVSISTSGTTTTVDIGGTTRLAQTMLNTFVENAEVGRVITNQLDVNLKIGGVARQLGAVHAARAMRPAIQAQILYGPR